MTIPDFGLVVAADLRKPHLEILAVFPMSTRSYHGRRTRRADPGGRGRKPDFPHLTHLSRRGATAG